MELKMSDKTKSCNLTEDEIKLLIMEVGREMDETNIDNTIDRMAYLNKRLKTFNEVEVSKPVKAEAAPASEKVSW
jgi:hypothetical protein